MNAAKFCAALATVALVAACGAQGSEGPLAQPSLQDGTAAPAESATSSEVGAKPTTEPSESAGPLSSSSMPRPQPTGAARAPDATILRMGRVSLPRGTSNAQIRQLVRASCQFIDDHDGADDPAQALLRYGVSAVTNEEFKAGEPLAEAHRSIFANGDLKSATANELALFTLMVAHWCQLGPGMAVQAANPCDRDLYVVFHYDDSTTLVAGGDERVQFAVPAGQRAWLPHRIGRPATPRSRLALEVRVSPNDTEPILFRNYDGVLPQREVDGETVVFLQIPKEACRSTK